MKVETYLSLIKKLNWLINNKQLEKEELFTLATKTTQVNDDMPHAPGVSDKVGNLCVKMQLKEQEIVHAIDTYVDLKYEIICQIETLPHDEYQVIHGYYVSNMKLSEIAAGMGGYSVDWIKDLKNRGISRIRVIESEAFKEACKLLKCE